MREVLNAIILIFKKKCFSNFFVQQDDRKTSCGKSSHKEGEEKVVKKRERRVFSEFWVLECSCCHSDLFKLTILLALLSITFNQTRKVLHLFLPLCPSQYLYAKHGTLLPPLSWSRREGRWKKQNNFRGEVKNTGRVWSYYFIDADSKKPNVKYWPKPKLKKGFRICMDRQPTKDTALEGKNHKDINNLNNI